MSGVTKDDVGVLAPGDDAFAITPSNSNYIPMTRGIYIASGTTLTVEMAGGTQILFTNLAVGVIHPLRVVRVFATGTNAGGIVGIL